MPFCSTDHKINTLRDLFSTIKSTLITSDRLNIHIDCRIKSMAIYTIIVSIILYIRIRSGRFFLPVDIGSSWVGYHYHYITKYKKATFPHILYAIHKLFIYKIGSSLLKCLHRGDCPPSFLHLTIDDSFYYITDISFILLFCM